MAWFSTRFSDLQGVHTIPETGSRYVRDPTILMFTVKCSILHSHIILLHICITGHISGLLIGDRGYACLRHLMTPYPEPHPDPETRFNVALSKTRARIKMSFGILKSRFSCLHGLGCAPKWHHCCLCSAEQHSHNKERESPFHGTTSTWHCWSHNHMLKDR